MIATPPLAVHRPITFLTLIVLAFALCPLTAVPAIAQEHDQEREIEAAKEKIHALLREAEELQEHGKLEAAEEHRRHAHELQQRLRRHLAELEQRHAERGEGDELIELIDGLEHGIVALRRLDRHDEAEHLNRIADELREKRAHRDRERHREQERERNPERENLERRVEIMRHAVEALARFERHDAADLMERAVHALEMNLEGRRDPEANQIRERAPKRGQQIELLALATKLLQDAGWESRAEAVGRLSRELLQQHRRLQREGGNEREIAMQQLETMRIARNALREAERGDSAELLHRAIRALEVALEGRRDEEAAHIREAAPGRGQRAELLTLAAQILNERGKPDRAERVGRLAREFFEQQQRIRDRAAREGGERGERDRPEADERFEHAMQRIERLEQMMERIGHALEGMQEQLRDIKRERDR